MRLTLSDPKLQMKSAMLSALISSAIMNTETFDASWYASLWLICTRKPINLRRKKPNSGIVIESSKPFPKIAELALPIIEWICVYKGRALFLKAGKKIVTLKPVKMDPAAVCMQLFDLPVLTDTAGLMCILVRACCHDGCQIVLKCDDTESTFVRKQIFEL